MVAVEPQAGFVFQFGQILFVIIPGQATPCHSSAGWNPDLLLPMSYAELLPSWMKALDASPDMIKFFVIY